MDAKEFIDILKNNGMQCLYNYHKHCDNIQNYVNTGFQFTPVFTNERSIAAYMTNYMYDKHLRSLNCSYINEFSLKLSVPFTEAEIESILKKHNMDLSLSKLKANSKKMIPDALFVFDEDGAFLEYKVCDHFMLSLLAEDFLKFLLYTDGYDGPVTFVFIMFKNDKGKLNLLNTSSVVNTIDFTVLDFKRDLSKIKKGYSIFYYTKNNKTNDKIRPSSNIEFTLLEDINNTLKDINESGMSIYDLDKIKDFRQNPLVNNMNFFGQNVVTARIVFDNYKYIKDVYDIISNNNKINDLFIDEKVKNFFNSMLDNEDVGNDYVKGMTIYFNNQVKKILENQIASINDVALNTSIKRSNWIIILIYTFIKDELNDSGLSEQIAESFKNNYEDFKEIQQMLKNAYPFYSDPKEKVNSLSVFLIVYIVKLYEIICDTNNDSIKFKPEYLNYKNKKHIIDNILDLEKLLDDKNRKSSVNFEQTRVSKLLDDTVGKLLNKYTKNETHH